MITVNTNMSSIIAQNSLYKSTNKMNTALQRLSTGLRINSAKDDAAGSAISTKLEYKISSYDVAKDNAQMGQSMLDTANSTLSKVNSMLQRMRDLSEQAANGTYGDDERKAMQNEIDALTEEIYRIKNTTEFNGKKIFGEEEKSEQVMTSIPTMSMADVSEADWSKTLNQVISISSAQELKKMAEILNSGKDSWHRTFALTADIDLNELEMTEEGNWTGISGFKGTFDGNGHVIANLTINRPNKAHQGLFSDLYNGTIKNVSIQNGNVSGERNIGLLVGALAANSTVENCHVEGTVKGNITFGGLVGYNNSSTITNSSSQGHVQWNEIKASGESGANAGGLVGGQGGNSKIDNCKSSSTVISDYFVGGLVGGNKENSTITNSKSNGVVMGRTGVGAFAGQNTTTGTVSGNEYNPNVNAGIDAVGSGSADGITANTNLNLSKKQNISVLTNLQVGIDSSSNSVITIDTGFSLDDLKLNVKSEYFARTSLDTIDSLMAKVSDKMTDIGATQNRLISTMEFQEVQRQALTSANSLIKDADIALESANYIKNQILQSVTSSILATANQNPQIALQLI